MRYRIVLAISLLALSTGSYATTLCQEKEQDIQWEANYAEKHNNQNRINRLDKTLSEVRADCINSRLRTNHQKKIAEQENETAKRQRDLARVKQEGDAGKVAKREHRLAEAQQELKEFETRGY